MGALPTSQHELLVKAAGHLRAALDLLDGADAAVHVGAHVDLAVNLLETELRKFALEPLERSGQQLRHAAQ